MSGEIRVTRRNWRAEVCALAIAGALAFAVTMTLFRTWNVNGFTGGAVAALTAYVLCRTAFGALWRGGDARRIAWELSPDALTLDGRTIPRASIRAVYCWPTRDAFGHPLPGWTVNIETGRKNTLLRSPTSGEGVEEAARELETLVRALGGQIPAL